MKSLLLPLLIMTSVASFNEAQAQSFQSKPGRAPVYSYCTEERFQGYINLASAMRDFVTPHEYADLYIPLKVKASQAKITLKNYGPLSATTHAAVLDIVKFVNKNQGSFDSLWEVEAFFFVAQDLMDMTQSLSRDLQ